MTTRKNQPEVHTVDKPASSVAPIDDDRTARIWDRIAPRYAAKPVADEDAYARKLAITREYLHPEAEVLELGCGTGSTAIAHAPYAKHIRAVDVSSRMIEIARGKAATAEIGNVEFACNRIDKVCTPEASLDAVLLLSVLHLLVDWCHQITSAYRVLKPGGVLVSNTMCLSDDFAFLRFFAPTGRIVGLLPQLSFFTRNKLEHTMTSTGFEIAHAWQPAPKTGVFIVARKPR